MEETKYLINGKEYTLAFPSFKKHNALRKMLKDYGEEAYNDFANVKSMLSIALKEDISDINDDCISYGEVAGIVENFFTKSMEMKKK